MSARKFDISRPKKYANVRIEHVGLYRNVILHKTCVLSVYNVSNTIRLDSGGWRTRTTMTAINTGLKQLTGFEGCHIYQAKGRWYFFDGKKGHIPFYDGMVLGGGFGAPVAVISKEVA